MTNEYTRTHQLRVKYHKNRMRTIFFPLPRDRRANMINETNERTSPNDTDVRLSFRSLCSRSFDSPRTRRSSNSPMYSPLGSRQRTSCTCRCSWRPRTVKTTIERSFRGPEWPCARNWDCVTFWFCNSWWTASWWPTKQITAPISKKIEINKKQHIKKNWRKFWITSRRKDIDPQ